AGAGGSAAGGAGGAAGGAGQGASGAGGSAAAAASGPDGKALVAGSAASANAGGGGAPGGLAPGADGGTGPGAVPASAADALSSADAADCEPSGANKAVTEASLAAEVLVASSLAREMAAALEGLRDRGEAHVAVNGWLPVSVCGAAATMTSAHGAKSAMSARARHGAQEVAPPDASPTATDAGSGADGAPTPRSPASHGSRTATRASAPAAASVAASAAAAAVESDAAAAAVPPPGEPAGAGAAFAASSARSARSGRAKHRSSGSGRAADAVRIAASHASGRGATGGAGAGSSHSSRPRHTAGSAMAPLVATLSTPPLSSQLRPFHALLLLDDAASTLRSLPSGVTPQTKALVLAASPLRSLQQLQLATGIDELQMLRLAEHLVAWGRAVAVPVVTRSARFVTATGAVHVMGRATLAPEADAGPWGLPPLLRLESFDAMPARRCRAWGVVVLLATAAAAAAVKHAAPACAAAAGVAKGSSLALEFRHAFCRPLGVAPLARVLEVLSAPRSLPQLVGLLPPAAQPRILDLLAWLLRRGLVDRVRESTLLLPSADVLPALCNRLAETLAARQVDPADMDDWDGGAGDPGGDLRMGTDCDAGPFAAFSPDKAGRRLAAVSGDEAELGLPSESDGAPAETEIDEGGGPRDTADTSTDRQSSGASRSSPAAGSSSPRPAGSDDDDSESASLRSHAGSLRGGGQALPLVTAEDLAAMLAAEGVSAVRAAGVRDAAPTGERLEDVAAAGAALLVALGADAGGGGAGTPLEDLMHLPTTTSPERVKAAWQRRQRVLRALVRMAPYCDGCHDTAEVQWRTGLTAAEAPAPLDSRAVMVLSLRIGRRAVSAARVASWMLLYSIGLAQRPRLREVGAGSSALTAFVLRSAWLAIAGLKNIVGADRWLTQLTAISVFQIASWAIRTTLAARPELAIMNRSISLPLLASIGVPAFPGWGESAARAADLQLAMRRCQTFAEYRRLAIALDRVTGMDAWRERDDAAPCGLLDSTELRRRISRYGRLERRQDARGLMWALRAELHRRPAGTGSPQLYGMAASGTKLVVEEHAHAAASALDFVCDSCPPEELVSRLAFFQETRHALGRTALLLSGGATNGIYHLGVIRALRDVHLLPPIVSGASAGSIVASLLG
ncbi:unnamed protein product, partial [Symbiodinium sp. KB8]